LTLLAPPPIAEPRDRGSLQNGIIDEQTVDAGGSYGVDIDNHCVGSASASTGAARDGYSFDPRRGWQNDAKAAQLLQQRRNYRGASIRRHCLVCREIEQIMAIDARTRTQSEMLGRLPKMFAASRVAARVILKNLPGRADLSGEKLDQPRRRLGVEA
jgi:hypothetical protein